MALAASGHRSLIVQRARKLLAASSTFQTWTGHAANATNAELHITDFELTWSSNEDKDTAETDVTAVVDVLGTRPLTGSRIYAGEVKIRIEAPVAAAYLTSPSEAFRDFENSFGAVFDDMLTSARADVTNTYLNVREEDSRAEACFRVSEGEADSDGDRMVGDIVLAFGPKG